MSTATTSGLYVSLSSGRAGPVSIAVFGVSPGRFEPEKWRIGFMYEGEKFVSSIGFERKRDAEMALSALIKEGMTDRESMLKVPFETRRRIMLEALQW